MSKKILVPLDGSEIGEAALHYVEEMVSNLEVGKKIEVILIHILALQTMSIKPQGLPYKTEVILTEEEIGPKRREALAYLEKSAEGMKSGGIKVECKVVVREANTSSAEEIIKAEEEYKVDLVAMSTHGRRGISRWAFGSVTEKVLRGGNVPVLVVRAKK